LITRDDLRKSVALPGQAQLDQPRIRDGFSFSGWIHFTEQVADGGEM
jgi:hypothetical protein